MLHRDDIHHEVVALARRNGAHKAILFGSYARGTATERSDIDLLFIERTELPFLSRLDRYFDPLADRFKTGIEIFVYTPEEFQRLATSGFMKQILKDGIVLYESRKV